METVSNAMKFYYKYRKGMQTVDTIHYHLILLLDTAVKKEHQPSTYRNIETC